MKRNLYTAFILTTFLFSCAHHRKKMWNVTSSKSGGTVAYMNYGSSSAKVWHDALKEHVSCPDNYVMGGHDNKSQTSQEYLYMPKQDQVSTTTTNYYGNSNYNAYGSYGNYLGSLSGNTSGTATSTTRTSQNGFNVIPYTSTVSWVEHHYTCDYSITKSNDPIKLRQQCVSGTAFACYKLASLNQDDTLMKGQLLRKGCEIEDKFQPGICNSYASHLLYNEPENKIGLLGALDKSCSGYGKYDKNQDNYASIACAYHAVRSGSKKDISKFLVEIKDNCLIGSNINSCYELACIHSLKGDKRKGIEYIGRLLKLGYKDFDSLYKDPDLDGLKGAELDFILDSYKSRELASEERSSN